MADRSRRYAWTHCAAGWRRSCVRSFRGVFVEYASFLAKTVTLVVAILVVLITAAALRSKGRRKGVGQLQVSKLNDFYKELRERLEQSLLDKDQLKALRKAKGKAEKKQKKQPAEDKPRVFVLDFNGDIKASATEGLRNEITALLSLATPRDEVVLRLESGGGMVHSYGLASSQLARIRQAGVPLTVCIDKVAASGGYMMACIGEKIISAPFAILGSIGVVAQLPNVNRLLKKHDIDFEVLTAGEYKRTLTVFGENTEKGREKFRRTWTSPTSCSRTSWPAIARNWPSTKWPPAKSGWVWRPRKNSWWTSCRPATSTWPKKPRRPRCSTCTTPSARACRSG